MRKTILAFLLSGATLVPAAARAQPDAGPPDGSAMAQNEQDQPHTGYSNDPNGNMGNEGRTGQAPRAPDAGTTSTGAEGTTGAQNKNTEPSYAPNPQHDQPPSIPRKEPSETR
jgi:hypothetical protein